MVDYRNGNDILISRKIKRFLVEVAASLYRIKMKKVIEYILPFLISIIALSGCSSPKTEGFKLVTEVYEPTHRAEQGLILLGENQVHTTATARSIGNASSIIVLAEPANAVFLNPAGLVGMDELKTSGGFAIKKITSSVDMAGQDTARASYGTTTFNLPVAFAAGLCGKLKGKLHAGISVHSVRDFNFDHEIVHYEENGSLEIYRYNYESTGELRAVSAGFGYGEKSSWSFGFYASYLFGSASSNYILSDTASVTGYSQQGGTAELTGYGFGGSVQYSFVPDTVSDFDYSIAMRFTPGDWLSAGCKNPYFAPDAHGQFDLHYPAELVTALLMQNDILKIGFQIGATLPPGEYISGYDNDEVSAVLEPEWILGTAFETRRGKVLGRMGLSYYDSNFLIGFGSSSVVPSLGSFDIGFGIGGGNGEFVVVFGFSAQVGKENEDSLN
ncbi:hypothetical protein JXI42_11010 [bacterium]|nr:hypothetical protein [bacterium]